MDGRGRLHLHLWHRALAGEERDEEEMNGFANGTSGATGEGKARCSRVHAGMAKGSGNVALRSTALCMPVVVGPVARLSRGVPLATARTRA